MLHVIITLDVAFFEIRKEVINHDVTVIASTTAKFLTALSTVNLHHTYIANIVRFQALIMIFKEYGF